MKGLLSIAISAVLLTTACSGPASASPTIVTQDNFPQAFTDLRLAGVLRRAGAVNTFFEMPVAPSVPEEQFVV